MSKKKQDARIKKYSKDSSYFYDESLKRIEEPLLLNTVAAQHLARQISQVSNLDLSEKKGRFYYEAFDRDTRGDKFRIEMDVDGYGINTRVYVNDRLAVPERMYIFELHRIDAKQDMINVDEEKIIRKLPSEYLKIQYRNNPSKQAVGGLLLAGLFGYAFMKRPR